MIARALYDPAASVRGSPAVEAAALIAAASRHRVLLLLGWLLAGEAVTVNVLLSAAMVISAVMLVDRGMAHLPKRS